MPLAFGSLFAGIGGFDLGFERAGMVCKWQVPQVAEWIGRRIMEAREDVQVIFEETE